jgi:hypothetical protein
MDHPSLPRAQAPAAARVTCNGLGQHTTSTRAVRAFLRRLSNSTGRVDGAWTRRDSGAAGPRKRRGRRGNKKHNGRGSAGPRIGGGGGAPGAQRREAGHECLAPRPTRRPADPTTGPHTLAPRRARSGASRWPLDLALAGREAGSGAPARRQPGRRRFRGTCAPAAAPCPLPHPASAPPPSSRGLLAVRGRLAQGRTGI